MKRRATLAAVLLLVSSAAAAQFGSRRRGGFDGGGARAGKGERQAVGTFEVTLHEFHEDLKLTAEQEPLWQNYESKLRAMIDDLARERSRQPGRLDVLQRIDRMLDTARNHLAAQEEIADAARALYAKLAPEQQAAADPRLATVMAMPLAPQQTAAARSLLK